MKKARNFSEGDVVEVLVPDTKGKAVGFGRIESIKNDSHRGYLIDEKGNYRKNISGNKIPFKRKGTANLRRPPQPVIESINGAFSDPPKKEEKKKPKKKKAKSRKKNPGLPTERLPKSLRGVVESINQSTFWRKFREMRKN